VGAQAVTMATTTHGVSAAETDDHSEEERRSSVQEYIEETTN